MKKFLTLFLIITLGAVLRFYDLSNVPVALYSDEAAFGYNAFSILETARDEHGQFLPISFKSVGDYKSPLFVYFLVPIVGLFGLSEITIRVPIALLGTLTILLTYLISLKIFKSEKAAILSALFITISPWSINFSRIGFDSMLGIFLANLTVLFLLNSINNRKWLFLATPLSIITVYSYHGQKLIIPILLFSFWILFKNQLNLSYKKTFSIVSILAIFAVPLLIGLTNISGQSRAQGSLVTTYLQTSTKDKVYTETSGLVNESASLFTAVFNHSKLVLAFTDISSKFYAYISPANVFVTGDEVGRHGVEDFGVLLPYELIFIIAGIYFFIKKTKTNSDKFLIVWLVASLLPAMITMDRLHTGRSFTAVTPLYIFEAWGLIQLLDWIKNRNKILICLTYVILIGIVSLTFMRFLHSYFVYTPIKRADVWQYGYKQVVETVKLEQNHVEKVVIDAPPTYGYTYIFFLFYLQYDPTMYNKTVRREDDLAHKAVPVFGFDKYEFRQIYWPDDRETPKTLFVGTDMSIPADQLNDPKKFKLIKEIPMPDGKIVFRIVETL